MLQPGRLSDLLMVPLMSPNTSTLRDTRSVRVVCGSGFKISISAGSMRSHQYLFKLGSFKFGEQPCIIVMVEWGPFDQVFMLFINFPGCIADIQMHDVV